MEPSDSIDDDRAKYDLTHARHDPAHCLVPGLFRSLMRGEREREKLDVTYTFGQGESLRFICFEPLGADDMRLLQGIVALGGPKGLILEPEPDTENGRQLRLLLDAKLEAAAKDAMVVKERTTRLLSEVGMSDGGKNIKALKASLIRMSNVSVIVTNGNQQASFHLMSHAIDGDDGRIMVALNPRITEAILGQRQHARINLKEVRALQSDPARLIHQRLCGWLDQGKSARTEIDTLCGYVWPNKVNDNAMKRRRGIAKKALTELQAIGWTIDEYARGKWLIKRPEAPK